MKYLVVIIIVVCSSNLFGQENKSGNSSSLLQTNRVDMNIDKLPLFDIYLGLGIATGGRIGARVRVKKDISIEIAYGLNFMYNLTGYKLFNIINLGLNWYLPGNKNFILHPNVLFYNSETSSKSKILLGVDFEYFHLNKKQWHLFGRAGLYTLVKGNTEDLYFGYRILPNLDFGIAFAL